MPRLRRLALPLLLTGAMLAGGPVQATEQRRAPYLLPTDLSSTHLSRPGEWRENRVLGERLMPITSGLKWQTLTDLRGTRYEQPYPALGQTFSLSTGPQLKLGRMELAMPFNTGRESSGLGETDGWRSAAPRLTVALGPNDRIRLEARVMRNEAATARNRRTTSVTWQRQLNDRWSLSTGLSQSSVTGIDDLSVTSEAHAGVNSTLPGGLLWSLTRRFSVSTFGIPGRALPTSTGHATSLSLSTRYPLRDGWWISGELRSTQSVSSDTLQPVTSRSGGLRLVRDF